MASQAFYITELFTKPIVLLRTPHTPARISHLSLLPDIADTHTHTSLPASVVTRALWPVARGPWPVTFEPVIPVPVSSIINKSLFSSCLSIGRVISLSLWNAGCTWKNVRGKVSGTFLTKPVVLSVVREISVIREWVYQGWGCRSLKLLSFVICTMIHGMISHILWWASTPTMFAEFKIIYPPYQYC